MSSAEEIQTIRDRVSTKRNDVIFFHELPVQNSFSVEISFDEVSKQALDMDSFDFIVDLTDANRPDAETRNQLNVQFNKLKEKLSHVYFVTGKNIFINTAIKFVMFGMGLKSYSVHRRIGDVHNKLGL